MKSELGWYCKCSDCGDEWDPLNTEHFNVSFCESCMNDNVKDIECDDDE